jgi:hypothetical protein
VAHGADGGNALEVHVYFTTSIPEEITLNVWDAGQDADQSSPAVWRFAGLIKTGSVVDGFKLTGWGVRPTGYPVEATQINPSYKSANPVTWRIMFMAVETGT